MMNFTHGDILKADAEAIVNTVNCVGVMGRGIALQFKKAWPENFKVYKKACDAGEVRPGEMFVFDTGQLTNPRYIVNFPTKRHWRGASRMEDVESGLQALAKWITESGVQSIAIPPLGAGLGGLDWLAVKDRIKSSLCDFESVDIQVYEPKGAPENDRIVRNKKAPNMTAGRAALIELMRRYLNGLLDPSITLLEVHKLMYFMQELGEPLRLKFAKAPYGPYAENLRHVFNAIEGHFISGYADGGDAPDKELKIVPGAVDEAERFLDAHPDTQERFDKVAKLVEGFESPFGLELLATTHWVMKHEAASTQQEVQERIYSWNAHKQQFTSRQIGVAMEVVSAI
ncbi:MAG: macro domain-containing protein [Hahellaceae bacterium]|nr:macro domain-containing protein [Hahellaceae bacterium]